MAEPNRTIADLVEDWVEPLRKAFLAALALIRDRFRIAFIAERLEKGDVEGAIAAVPLDPVAFRGLDVTVGQAFEDGGDFTMGRIPALREPSGHVLNILFNVRNPRAESWLRDHSSTLVTQIVEDQRVMVRQHLTAGMEAGINPRQVALDLVGRINPATRQREGGVIGLTASQEEWARRYAQELAEASPDALKRALRDKRFDRTVQKAIREGAPIPAEMQAKMLAAYRNRALKYRAEMLARTEAMTALHEGQEQAFSQALEAGQVQENRVRRFWRSAGDHRVRHDHRLLNGKSVGYREAFVAADGSRIRFPGDPEAPAHQRIGCRCWMQLRIDHLAR